VSVLIQLFFNREDVRTESKIEILNTINFLLNTKEKCPQLKIDWKSNHKYLEFHFLTN